MEIIVSLLVGIILGSSITYYIAQKSQHVKTIREYESRIQTLEKRHQQDIKDARNRSIDGSRAVIKGKIAEQLAPVLPNFKYLPSDARFIGDPIDYIIFNGYTQLKDNSGSESDLEIIILDVKTGNASLSQLQQAIAKAINAGKVRFEVIRPDAYDQNQLNDQNQQLQPSFPPQKYITDIRKKHPRAYEAWTKEEDEKLIRLYREGLKPNQLAIEFQRQIGGIRSRLKKLGLL
ncbi:Holliday junction resolvase-like protein [Pseudanabaena sp. ABRG5-3]|uniref:Holliday junction resolvase-like protein n=1 Tax=Pseudanabaena sp. ABRG5-3 TaxID=685565 RepID=UPI000DC6F9DC|nr:Holliday junction resolvase-like protein [Pseudanabaena sp. ABRG5-3]BBC25367.1 secreted endonuclease distantly related to Holliday junction resolvase [Pseudanabaena sp. ABRG5-3]